MKLSTDVLRRRLVFGVVGGILFSAFAAGIAEPVLERPVRTSDGGFRLRVSGSAEGQVIVQASPDLRQWEDIGTVQLAGGEAILVDPSSSASGQRYYRLKVIPPDLPDLGTVPNTVFMAGEGFDTLQFAPSGMLGLIVWRQQELIYRERSRDGVWTEAVISRDGSNWTPKNYDEHRFQPPAMLFYDSQSRPHILRGTGQGIVHHLRQSNQSWSEQMIATPFSATMPALMAAAMGPSDRLHVAVVSSGSSPVLSYGSNASGRWEWSRVTALAGKARGFLPQAYSPRFFSLAVDSKGHAHLAFTPAFRMPQGPGGYVKPSSDLAYASNRSGQWRIETVQTAADGSGDAGLGASIAIGPGDEPAIASWYNERAATGSAQWSKLFYHRRDTISGQWRAIEVAKSPDGYVAGDGPRGAGFAPYLRFDASGRPHILFSDHASEHFSSGQNEFAGQVRHGTFDGRQWSLRTLYRQRAPLQGQMIYPAMALNGTEFVWMGLERRTDWRSDYRVANSTYRFVFVLGVLP